MGERVPAHDLPGSLVPASDLPNGPAPNRAPAANLDDVTGTQRWEQQTAGGMFEVPRAMVQNMGANVASGFAGLAGAVLPGPEGQGADWVRRTQQALSYEPQAASARGTLKVLGLPGEAISAVGHKVGEQGARVSPALGAIGETSVEGLATALGARSAAAPKAKLTAAQQRVADARDAGFKMTPEEMGAGPVARGAASLAGEPRLARALSNKNADVALAKAKQELGLHPDAVLDLDTLKLIRKQEGAKYDTLRNTGQVTMDRQYLADIDKIAAKYKSAAEEFPGAQKLDQLALREIDDAITMLKKEDPAIAAARAQGIRLPQQALGPQTFTAAGAVDMIHALREGADGAFRSGKGQLGKVMRGGAEALEAQLERHLKATGQGEVLKDFQAARARIAKAHTVEDALLGDDKVNMRSFGADLADNRPLTGGLKESGEFARNFDRSSQKPNFMPSGAAFGDLALSVVNSLKGKGLGADILTLGARPVARSVLQTGPAQYLMDPRTNLSGAGMQAIGASTALPPPPQEERR